jgi:ribosomal protein S18 acetylase RimI-like enzyme
VIDTSVLVNPVWVSLTGPQAALGLGGSLGRCFPHELSPFAGLADGSPAAWAELAGLVPSGQVRALADLESRPPARDWDVVEEFPGVQLTFDADSVGDPAAELAASGWRVVPLGPPDVGEMLDLVARTRPGPFGPRTVEFGGFHGVRADGLLGAMAGQRLRVPGWTEVSGVATAAELRGRGLGGLLTRLVCADILARGDRPFLHAMTSNVSAVRLYRALGFGSARALTFTIVSRR